MKKYKYQKTWVLPDGRRAVVRADTKEDLMRKYNKKRYGIDNVIRELTPDEIRMVLPFSEQKSAVTLSVRDWAEKAVNIYKRGAVSDAYYYGYVMAMRKHVLNVIGDYDIKDVTTDDCQLILNNQKNMSLNHINQIYQILTFIFGTARRRKKITEDPTKDLTKPKHKNKQKRRALTEDEREALLKVFEKYPAEMLVFRIMYFTGARPSEVWRMRRGDIIEVNGALLIKIKGTKTASATRAVPFPKELFNDIKDLKVDELLVKSEQGQPMGKQLYKRRSKRLAREMDIMMGAELYRNKIVNSKLIDFTPYNLRHDYCTRLRDNGTDIRVAQRLMGHSTIQLTAAVYTHIDDNTIANEATEILKGVTAGVT